jgi:hypothetical protein
MLRHELGGCGPNLLRVPEQEVSAGQADELAVRDPARHLTPDSQLAWIVDRLEDEGRSLDSFERDVVDARVRVVVVEDDPLVRSEIGM